MLFCNDDSDEDNLDTSIDEKEKDSRVIVREYLNYVFVELLKLKSKVKLPDSSSFVFQKLEILFVKSDPCYQSHYLSDLLEKYRGRLSDAGLTNISIIQSSDINKDTLCDVLVMLPYVSSLDASENIEKNLICKMKNYLVAGGTLFNCLDLDQSFLKHFFPYEYWNFNKMESITISNRIAVKVSKRNIACNTSAATYWTGLSQNSNPELRERDLLDELTVACTLAERRESVLTAASRRKAIHALRECGLCIFRGLFPPDCIRAWGDAALGDLEEAMARLRERDIDLDRPGEGAFINNFYELSMREARRCDLRNGRRMTHRDVEVTSFHTVTANKQVPRNKNAYGSQLRPSYDDMRPKECRGGTVMWDVRGHPDVKFVLNEVMNPNLAEGDDVVAENAKGNWGRWNFGGSGPEGSHPPLVAGKLGAVCTLPGCLDQTIHADTAHLYPHAQVRLPNITLLRMPNMMLGVVSAVAASLCEYVPARLDFGGRGPFQVNDSSFLPSFLLYYDCFERVRSFRSFTSSLA